MDRDLPVCYIVKNPLYTMDDYVCPTKSNLGNSSSTDVIYSTFSKKSPL